MLATDLALTVTERLRRLGLAGQFVEFFGAGRPALSAGDRAVVANMAPEYGASSGFFPIDEQTLRYLRATGRAAGAGRPRRGLRQAAGPLVRSRRRRRATRTRSRSTSARSASASPGRAGRRIALAGRRRAVAAMAPCCAARPARHASRASPATAPSPSPRSRAAPTPPIPRLMVAAGLLARKARRLGPQPHRLGQDLLRARLADGGALSAPRRAAGGSRGARLRHRRLRLHHLHRQLRPAARRDASRPSRSAASVPVAVLSGNRNFPGRVHPQIEAGFLASPPLVVAYALAGDVNRDILTDPDRPLGRRRRRSVWPISGRPATRSTRRCAGARSGRLRAAYDEAEASDDLAQARRSRRRRSFPWDATSTYIRRPPFASAGSGTRLGPTSAHPLLVLGDDITTDHISPAGADPGAAARPPTTWSSAARTRAT